MVKFVSQMAQTRREGWSCVTMVSGVSSGLMHGHHLLQELCAHNLDFLENVSPLSLSFPLPRSHYQPLLFMWKAQISLLSPSHAHYLSTDAIAHVGEFGNNLDIPQVISVLYCFGPEEYLANCTNYNYDITPRYDVGIQCFMENGMGLEEYNCIHELLVVVY